jgi:hypothetical protein
MDIEALETICVARQKAKYLLNHGEEIHIVNKTFDRKENMESHISPAHI